MYHAIIVNDQDQDEIVMRMLDRHSRRNELTVSWVASAGGLKAFFEPLGGGGLVDVLFMDVGFGPDEPEAVRQFVPEGSGIQVIHLTAYAEHCTRAYRTPHVYFLDKLVKQSDFDDALGGAPANLDVKANAPLCIKAGNALVRVVPRHIICLVSDRRKIRLHGPGKTVEAYATLSELARDLPPIFVQCHKSFLASLEYVVELRKGCALLSTGEEVPISQKRRKAMREVFLAHLQRCP